MKTAEDLRALLQRIDHRSYPAYKDLRGSYNFTDYILLYSTRIVNAFPKRKSRPAF